MCCHTRQEESEEHTALGTKGKKTIFVHDDPANESSQHHVTEEELRRVTQLMWNGMSMECVLTTLDQSLPDTGPRGRRSNKREHASQLDVSTFKREQDSGEQDKEIAAAVVAAVELKSSLVPKEGLDHGSKSHNHSKRAKLTKRLEADLKRIRTRLREGQVEHPNTHPRFLCVFGNITKEQTRTQIEKSTQPAEKLEYLNKGDDATKTPWFPCLYVKIPPHIRNGVLLEVVELWKQMKRRIKCRTVFGIFLAEVLEGEWFISQNLNTPEFKQLSPFFKTSKKTGAQTRLKIDSDAFDGNPRQTCV